MKHWIFGLGKNSNGLPLGAICPYVYRKKTLNPLIRRIIIASSVLLLAISLALSQPNPLWSTSSAAKPHHGNSSYHWMRNRGHVKEATMALTTAKKKGDSPRSS